MLYCTLIDQASGDMIGRSVSEAPPRIGEHFTFKKTLYRVVHVNHGDLTMYKMDLYVTQETKPPFRKTGNPAKE